MDGGHVPNMPDLSRSSGLSGYWLRPACVGSELSRHWRVYKLAVTGSD